MLQEDPKSLHEVPSANGSNGSTELNGIVARPVIEVIACGGADAQNLVEAAKTLDADVQAYPSSEDWFGGINSTEESTLSDLLVLVGAAPSIVDKALIEKVSANRADTDVLAAVIDTSVKQAAELVKKGVRGLLSLPAEVEPLRRELHWFVGSALQSRPQRIATANHRKHLSTLTDAEADVLDAMIEGLANKQIAQRLEVSLRTIELRRSKIMRKMEANNLSQLIHSVCMAKSNCC